MEEIPDEAAALLPRVAEVCWHHFLNCVSCVTLYQTLEWVTMLKSSSSSSSSSSSNDQRIRI
jgi:hypothetical protein